MHYLTFTLKDPTTNIIGCVGVKYKKTEFSDKDITRITKAGTANKEVKAWLKDLKKEDKSANIEILYRGDDSAEACYWKQKHIINHKDPSIDLIGTKISTKKYTKRLRANEEMRRAIIDQFDNEYSGVLEAAEQLLLAPSNISKVLHGKLDHIGGFKFRFRD